MSDAKVVSECRRLILSQSGPLDRLTTEARRAFARYMGEEVEVGDVCKSRAWHYQHTEGFKPAFSARLKWVGKHAMNAAEARYAAAMERGEEVRDLVSLELSDLLEASAPRSRLLPDSGGCG